MKYIILFVFFLSFSKAFSQSNVVQSVMLDSVMISAVKDGFSVDEFIHYVKTDTTFYKGFKNLRYYAHEFESELTIFNVKKEKVGFLYRNGTYEINNNLLNVKVDSLFDDGKVFNKRGEYRYYTPEFFDYIFFPKDTIKVSKYSSKNSDDNSDDKNEKNEKDARVIVFNPGSIEVEKNTGNTKKKLAIFDIGMQKYYDYILTKTLYKDSIECYEFTCRMKSNLSEKDQGDVLIRELVSYFDKDNFNVLYRKYAMNYNYWIFDLNVVVEVEMGYSNNILVPKYIYYDGFWDLPLKKAEIATFKLWNKNFEYRN